MHGNRDFLIGGRFASAASVEILADPTVIDIGLTPVLLMHGDTLCTDDVAYQTFRSEVRSSDWQRAILAKPFAERVALAQSLRSQSDIEKSMKPDAIMDVNANAVAAALRQFGYAVMVHGHTHRPARHETLLDGHACVRWVLPDWHEVGGYLALANGAWCTTTLKA